MHSVNRFPGFRVLQYRQVKGRRNPPMFEMEIIALANAPIEVLLDLAEAEEE